MNMEEIKIQSRPIFGGRVFRVQEDTVRLSDGTTALREVVQHNGGSCVAAVTENKELLMVRQFRYGAGKVLWELPAGKLEVGEDPLVCAMRELEEETGYRTEQLHSLGCMHPTPAYCGEVIYMYYTTRLIPSAQHLDEGEFLQVEAVPFDRVLAMIMDGQITDAKTVIAILKLKEILQ